MGKVGSKYQAALDREARHRLGVRPGWVAVQEVEGDRLVIRFLPPEHERSLSGVLHAYAKPASSDDLRQEREASWAREVRDRRP